MFEYLHVRPSMLPDDVNSFTEFSGGDVHFGGSLRLIAALGPVSLLGDQHLLVQRVPRSNVFLRE